LLALLFSLSTPGLDTVYHFDPTVERICVDTGASACISTQKGNFIHLHPVNNLKINGIGSGLLIEGIGVLKWSVRDDSGNQIDLFVKDALYVPTAPMGLLCPQQVAQQTGTAGNGFQALAHGGVFQFQGYRRTIPYEQHTRLPIFHTMECRQAIANLALNAQLDSAPSRTQQLLLRWHNCLSHMSFSKLQVLARQGRLPKQIATCEHPICSSCQMGKAHRRPVTHISKMRPIDAEDLQPGDRVSVDQIESSTPGMVDTYSGKPTSARYHAASLYTDHASPYMYIKCHYSTGGAEAVLGKQKFEQLAATHGVKIKASRADNGIMSKKEYMQDAANCQQSITLSGVNQHNQNGIAERNIRTVCDRAQTMLFYAISKWPDEITIDLWPFALKLAVDVHNATPGPSGLSPEEIFSKQKSRADRLVDFHTFGCPVFVLEPRLQQGLRIPKWQPCSRQAIYLGHSPRHAQTVPIVLNRKTMLCSPQYHVVFDDQFSTVPYIDRSTAPPNWGELFHHHQTDVLADDPETASQIQLSPELLSDPSDSPAHSEGVSPLSEGVPATSEGAPVDRTPESASSDSVLTLNGGLSTPLSDVENTAPGPPDSTHATPLVPPAATLTSSEGRQGWNPNNKHNTRFRA